METQVCGMSYGGNCNFMGEWTPAAVFFSLTINLKGGWVPSFVQSLNLGQFLVKTHKVFLFCENLLEKVNTCT